jgi:membrane protease YdiL (CAAX protease family)
MSVFIIPATVLLNNLMVWVISQFQGAVSPQPVMIVLQESSRLSERIALGFTAIVLAPVFEESLFRGILYPAIKKAGYPTLALAGTSLLFGAIHATVLTFLPLTFLAIMLAVLYERTDSLLAPVIGHALFNAVNFAYALLVAGKATAI